MAVQLLQGSTCLSSLRKRWAALTLTGALLLAIGYALLHAGWRPDYALQWLFISASGMAYLSWTLWRGLADNYRAGEVGYLLPTIGAGNLLTLLRGALIATLAGFLFSPRPPGWLAWLPGLLYTFAAFSDLFDGYLARRANHATRLGEQLDLHLDGLGVLIAALLLVQYGQVPPWYLLVGLARYLFLAGIWLRRRWGKPVYELAHSAARRPFAGAQMGFIGVVLLPLFSPPGTHLAGALFALPFLAGFTIDWLTVSGVISAGFSSARAQSSDRVQRILLQWIPVLLRAIVAAVLAFSVAAKMREGTTLGSLLPGPGYSLGLILFLAGLALIALGTAGRAGALLVLIAIGLQQPAGSLAPVDLFLITGATALFFLGTGTFSLWTPENRIIERRLGEK
jgi:CDP-diacylglycerol--glycerol-3-phosphate 3-phosphatidyltransferase